MSVIPLVRRPAYTPMDEPGRCMTPGHEERPAGHYPGGWLCDHCIRASRRAYRSSAGSLAAFRDLTETTQESDPCTTA